MVLPCPSRELLPLMLAGLASAELPPNLCPSAPTLALALEVRAVFVVPLLSAERFSLTAIVTRSFNWLARGSRTRFESGAPACHREPGLGGATSRACRVACSTYSSRAEGSGGLASLGGFAASRPAIHSVRRHTSNRVMTRTLFRFRARRRLSFRSILPPAKTIQLSAYSVI